MSRHDVAREIVAETGELAAQIDAIVAQIKRAIVEVGKDASQTGPRLTIKEAELTLSAVVTRGSGGDLRFSIFGHDIGLSGELTKADTQAIQLKLRPAGDDAITFAAKEISEKLVAAMRAIRDSIAASAADTPRFDIEAASVELNFQVDKNGDISFIVSGEAKTTNVQTVKLTLAPA